MPVAAESMIGFFVYKAGRLWNRGSSLACGEMDGGIRSAARVVGG